MKKIFTLLILCTFLVYGYSQTYEESLAIIKGEKKDSVKPKTAKDTLMPAILSAGFAASGNGLYIGASVFMDDIFGPVGIYGQFLLPYHKDSIYMKNCISAGLTVRTVQNFFLNAGVAFGKEQSDSKVGFEFGASYYTGIKRARMALQVGYNTALQSPVIGFRVGIGVF